MRDKKMLHDAYYRQKINVTKFIVREGWQGYGLYWGLLEESRLNDDLKIVKSDLEVYAMRLNVPFEVLSKMVTSALELGLLQDDGTYLYCDWVKEDAEKFEDICKKRSRARKGKTIDQQLINNCSTNDNQLINTCSTIDEQVQGTGTGKDKGKLEKGLEGSLRGDQGGGRKPKPVTQDLELPPELDTILVRNTLAEWEAHRSEIKKPLTARALKMLLNSYHARPVDLVRDIEHSIANGYQGVFPAQNGNGKAPRKKTQSEIARELFAKFAADENSETEKN